MVILCLDLVWPLILVKLMAQNVHHRMFMKSLKKWNPKELKETVKAGFLKPTSSILLIVYFVCLFVTFPFVRPFYIEMFLFVHSISYFEENI